MDIETLELIKSSANEALSGRKKLKKAHDSYVALINSGGMTRARTTSYNAKTHDIMKNQVEPNEAILKATMTT